MNTILKQLRQEYEVVDSSKGKGYLDLHVYCCKNRCNRVNITVWKDETFGVFGDDDSPQGKESIPLTKLHDLLEILL